MKFQTSAAIFLLAGLSSARPMPGYPTASSPNESESLSAPPTPESTGSASPSKPAGGDELPSLSLFNPASPTGGLGGGLGGGMPSLPSLTKPTGSSGGLGNLGAGLGGGLPSFPKPTGSGGGLGGGLGGGIPSLGGSSGSGGLPSLPNLPGSSGGGQSGGLGGSGGLPSGSFPQLTGALPSLPSATGSGQSGGSTGSEGSGGLGGLGSLFGGLTGGQSGSGLGSGSAIGALPGGGGSTENGLDGSCGDLTVIFARGTSEPGNVGIISGPPMFKSLRAKLGDDKVVVQGVDYPASAAGNANMGAAGGPAMAEQVKAAKSKCPNTKIILSGYSQGAMVVHNAFKQGVAAGDVAGAVLFGDPLKTQSVGDLGADAVKQFCGTSDTICGTGTSPSGGHTSYGSVADEAAAFAIKAAGLA